MRLIDADTLLETIEDHITAVSCCPTVDWSRGKTQMKEQAIEDINNAPTIGGWISVKERLPDRQTPVLVYVPPYSDEDEKYFGYVGAAYHTYTAIGGYWAGTDGNVYGAIGIIHDPTHWMPLPEPPEEEKPECG